MLSAPTPKAVLTVLFTSLETCNTPRLRAACWIISLRRKSLLGRDLSILGQMLVGTPVSLLVVAGGNRAWHRIQSYKEGTVELETLDMRQAIFGIPCLVRDTVGGGGCIVSMIWETSAFRSFNSTMSACISLISHNKSGGRGAVLCWVVRFFPHRNLTGLHCTHFSDS